LLISISGCKFPLPVAVFLQSVDELLEFMQTWGFAISFAAYVSQEIDMNIIYTCGGGTMQPVVVEN